MGITPGLLQQADRELHWRTRYGHIPFIRHAEHNEQCAVLVGETTYVGPWRTFIDFLQGFIARKLNPEWFRRELAKQNSQQHPVAQWSVAWTKLQLNEQTRLENGIFITQPDGLATAYIFLAYDFYLLEQHGQFPNKLLKRLRSPDQFQGALYEIQVAAMFIRAGFRIKWCPNKGTDETHGEFIACHPVFVPDGLEVEAKSKHRFDILGAAEGSKVEAGPRIALILAEAFKKQFGIPKIICLDLNLPATPEATFDKPWFEQFRQEYDGMLRSQDKGKYNGNIVVFTNNSFHYGQPGIAVSPDLPFFGILDRVEHEFTYTKQVVELFTGQFGKPVVVPEFEEHDPLVLDWLTKQGAC